MKISMYYVRVRFVRDANGPLEAKPKRVLITLAHDHDNALQHAQAYFTDVVSAGVLVEYSTPIQMPDTTIVEAIVPKDH